MTILPIGGRIKSASVGLDHLCSTDVADVDRVIALLKRDPFPDLQRAFFPRAGNELKQVLRGVGFYRPSLKTDQGMPGNFLPFTIDPSIPETDTSVRSIDYEEGIAIPEHWHRESNRRAKAIQAAFLKLDLPATSELLQDLNGRRAEKGRMPFFFIRPALPSRPIVVGNDTLAKVETAVRALIDQFTWVAWKRESALTGNQRRINLIYAQPDAFVLRDSTVAIERINCPDVGFFLADIAAEGSIVLPQLREIILRLLDAVVGNILEKMGSDVTIVTRDEVLSLHEDVLEIREIDALRRALESRGANVSVISTSAVAEVRHGARLLLLNLDYRSESAKIVMRRHAAGEVECFPNPFFQKVCQEKTGLGETKLDLLSKHGKTFLDLSRSQPATDCGRRDVLRQIDRALTNTGMESDIIHVVLPTETVPVLRKSLHSWRQFAARLSRPENQNGCIRFRGIPANPENLLLTSTTGPRLHAFRFMCVT